jgi:hypothetical protein
MMPVPSRIEEVRALLLEPEAKTWAKMKRGRRGTVAYIAEKTGMWEPTICKHLRKLRADGMAHVGKWNPTVGNPAAVWFAGPGEDVPAPTEKPPGYYSKRWRKNVTRAITNAQAGKKFDERYVKHVRLAQADDTVQRLRQAPNHWLFTLGAA